MVGASFYVGIPGSTKKSAYDCVSLAADQGITKFFTTVQMPEADIPGSIPELKRIGRLAREMNLSIMADAHPIAFGRVGGSVLDLSPFAEIGINAIRLDAGFTDEDTITLFETAKKQGFEIILNAGPMRHQSVQRLQDLGLDVQSRLACHNYYPRIESAMSGAYAEKQADLIHQYGMRVMAFVASQSNRRFMTYEGLPTLERHRNLPPQIAARELLARGWADEVYIGDQTESVAELKAMRAIVEDPFVILRIRVNEAAGEAEKKIMLGRIHQHLPQEFEVSLRTRGDRQRPELELMVPLPEALPRPRGTIAVDNVYYPRYAGELHVAKVDLPADPRTNVVGWIIEDDLPLIEAVQPGTRFAFEPVS